MRPKLASHLVPISFVLNIEATTRPLPNPPGILLSFDQLIVIKFDFSYYPWSILFQISLTDCQEIVNKLAPIDI